MRPDELTLEAPCFFLGYYDRALRIPFVQTYIYRGINIFGERDEDHWFFHEAEAYAAGGGADTHPNETDDSVIAVAADGLSNFVSISGLISELGENLSMQQKGKSLAHKLTSDSETSVPWSTEPRGEMSRLKPYAEPVGAAELEPGKVYFRLNYFDTDMRIPDWATLVFLGTDVLGIDDSLLYFQDYGSCMATGPYPNNNPGPGDIFQCSAEQLQCMFSLTNALDELRRCAMRQTEKPFDRSCFSVE